MNPRHVVVIGAARSGTKMLRDALALATGSGKVPYDIGYVWRIGNEGHADDVLEPEMVSERARRYIRGFVDGYADGEPPVVIEKTVGNALRVPAVANVFPEARFVHLLRDGVDVVESTRRQWLAPMDLRYVLAKSRHFPIRLAPRHGTKYVGSLASRWLRNDRRMATWGPRYPGIDADLCEQSLLTVCARQWRHSVVKARSDLKRLGLEVMAVRYESFVTDPTAELIRLSQFLGLEPQTGMQTAARRIIDDRQGIGRHVLTMEELVTVEMECGDTLDQLGYARAISPNGAGKEDDRHQHGR